ncbi:hypothetical protein [Sphingomonas crusticola]|uniref:hypothetical protein n=1 Tax=Sphingomonas crusticola TaxID=1697973 RepID=UPI0013C30353|nr:hypothetical protein [Sphingomonas crusticola]
MALLDIDVEADPHPAAALTRQDIRGHQILRCENADDARERLRASLGMDFDTRQRGRCAVRKGYWMCRMHHEPPWKRAGLLGLLEASCRSRFRAEVSADRILRSGRS